MSNQVEPEKLFREPNEILGIDLTDRVSVRFGTKSTRPPCKPNLYDGQIREMILKVALLNLYLRHHDDHLPSYVRFNPTLTGFHIDIGSSMFKIYSWMDILGR